MSIGATLAAARRRAGLTLGDVSGQTRIREGIIRGIERDDYADCGGDFYARGHIRSIARVVGADPGPLVDEYDAIRQDQAAMAAGADIFLPTAATGMREPRRPSWVAVLLALAVLAVLGFVGLRLIQSGQQAPGAAAPPVTGASLTHHRRAAHHPRPVISHAAAAVPARPVSSSRVLIPVSAQAFGPRGPGQGDDPGQAGLAIDGSQATAWHSSWYTTPRFGNLQSGTGLLLDMGRPVTIRSAQLRLGSIPGADLQLRAGRAPVLAGLSRVAGAKGAAGLVRLRLATPARARYVLIWFTRLPPDQAGTFQVRVRDVRLRGQP